MTEQSQILVFGVDALLVETRSEILEKAGFTVARAMNFKAFECEMREKQITLLLLCHSLAPAICEKAVDVALDLNPDVVILLLSAGSDPLIRRADVAVHYISGPEKLLEIVRVLLPQLPY